MLPNGGGGGGMEERERKKFQRNYGIFIDS